MKFRMNNKYFKWGLMALLVIIGSILFYYLLFHGTNIKTGFNTITKLLMPIVFGFGLAYIVTPILNTIEYRIMYPLLHRMKWQETDKKRKGIRAISIILTLFLFFAIIYSLIAMLMSQIVPSISNIISNFDTYINNFIKWLNKLLSDDYPEIGAKVIDLISDYSLDLEEWLNDNVLTKTSELIKTVSLSVISVLKLLWNILLGLMISVYVLASKERFSGQIKKMTYAMFNNDVANVIINNFRYTHRTFIGFLSGKILDSIIIGILCFIGTSILQTPYAVLVSVVIGVTNVIPVFGPYLGAIPSIVLIFVVDPLHPLNCLYFALFILILQQFDGNVLGPKILGDSTGLAGFWVIFSITLFGGIFGVMGMVVGVPVFAVLYAAIKSFVHNVLQKKNIPCETDAYINVAAIKNDKLYEYVPDYKVKKVERKSKYYGREFLYNMDETIIAGYEEVTAEKPDKDKKGKKEDSK